MATYTYCSGHVTGVHVRPEFNRIKERYRGDLRNRQYRYQEASGRYRGGIAVSDALAQRHGGMLFI